MTVLVLLHEQFSPPVSWSRVCIFGFREHFGLEHIICSLAFMLSRGREWWHRCPVYIISCDVMHAFDRLKPRVVSAAMRARGIPAALNAAFQRELLDLRCFPNFGGVEAEPNIFNSCFRQGGVEAPYGFNDTTCDMTSGLVEGSENHNYGVKLGAESTHQFTHA